jgi:hypothetical protein
MSIAILAQDPDFSIGPIDASLSYSGLSSLLTPSTGTLPVSANSRKNDSAAARPFIIASLGLKGKHFSLMI